MRCFVSFFYTGKRGIFGTQSNIDDGALLRERLTAKSCKLFLLKSSTIDFWLGSKYGSWQYCQKKAV